MPYSSREDLPEAVKQLPDHAQEIWMAAFNSAFEEYGGDEERAFKVAWAAVSRDYEKNEAGEWVRKKEVEPMAENELLEEAGGGEEKGLISRLCETVKKALADFFRPTGAGMHMDGRLVVVKTDSGRRRWVGAPTNNLYPDLEKQGISKAALGAAIAEGEGPIALDIAHLDPLVVGHTDHVGMADSFVVATGLEDDTPTAKAFFDYVEAHPELDLRMSMLFNADPEWFKAGVYDSIEILRFTVAPGHLAVNPHTMFAVPKSTGGDDMAIVLDDRIRPFLVGVYGEEKVLELENELATRKAAAVAAGAVEKAEEVVVSAPEEPAPTEEEVPTEEKPAEAPAPTAADVLQAVKALGDALGAQIAALTTVLQQKATAAAAPNAPPEDEESPSPLRRRRTLWPAEAPPVSAEPKQTNLSEAGIPLESPLRKQK